MTKQDELEILGEFSECILRLDYNCELPTFKTEGLNKNVFNYAGIILESIRDKFRESTISRKSFDAILKGMDEAFIIVTDDQFQIRAMNSNVELFLADVLNEVLGDNIYSLFPEFEQSQQEERSKKEPRLIRIKARNPFSHVVCGTLYVQQVKSDFNEINEIIFVFKPRNKEIDSRFEMHSKLSNIDNVIAGLDQLDSSLIQIDLKKNIYDLRTFLADEISSNNAGHVDSKLDVISIQRIVSTITEELQYIYKFEHIVIEIIDEIAGLFRGDYCKIYRILKSVVLNAIQFQDKLKNQAIIKISAKQHNDGLMVVVSDNGIGIEEKFQQQIFKGGFTVDSKREGSGYGLFFAKNCLMELGGSINLTSAVGVGSVFEIYLPSPTS